MESNTSQTALLVMDMQMGTLSNYPNTPVLVEKVSRAITYARQKGIKVIYVVVGFRPGLPEIGTQNKGFSTAKPRFASISMEEFMQIHPSLVPGVGEITVTKRRVSAFTGSDLEVILKAWQIQELILTGIATSGVVLSTTREASDKDYGLTILSDCCADGDEEVHRVLTSKIFPRQATVYTLEEWMAQ